MCPGSRGRYSAPCADGLCADVPCSHPIPGDPSGLCITYPVLEFIQRLAASSSFLSCTGPNSFENNLDAERTLFLETNGCGAGNVFFSHAFGYRATNTTTMPMTFWVSNGPDTERWWTVLPGEEIRFNVANDAYLQATTAEAIRICSPNLLAKKVATSELSPDQFAPVDRPVELLSYSAAPAFGRGKFSIFRDKKIRFMLDLAEYPNYFLVGLSPKPTDCGNPFFDGKKGGLPAKLAARALDKSGQFDFLCNIRIDTPVNGESYPELQCF